MMARLALRPSRVRALETFRHAVACAVVEENRLAVHLDVAAVAFYVADYAPDLVKTDLCLLVGVRPYVCLGVVVAEIEVVDRQRGGGSGLAEFTGHEDICQTHQPQTFVVVETEDAGELEALHGGQPVASRSVGAGEAQQFVKTEKPPDAFPVPGIAVKKLMKADDAEYLVEVVRVRIRRHRRAVFHDAGVGVVELPPVPLPSGDEARQTRRQRALQLSVSPSLFVSRHRAQVPRRRSRGCSLSLVPFCRTCSVRVISEGRCNSPSGFCRR